MNDKETEQALKAVEELRASLEEVKTALVGDMKGSRGLLAEVDRANDQLTELRTDVDELRSRTDQIRSDIGPVGSLQDRLTKAEGETIAPAAEPTIVQLGRIAASGPGIVVMAILAFIVVAVLRFGLGQTTDPQAIPVPPQMRQESGEEVDPAELKRAVMEGIQSAFELGDVAPVVEE